ARQRFAEAQAMMEKALGPDHPEVATIQVALAESLLGTHELPAARPLLARAKDILVAHYGQESPRVALVLNAQARLARDDGDLEGSLAIFDAADRIREAQLGPFHPLVAQNLRDRAVARWRAGAYGGALEDSLRAESIARDHLRSASRILSEREALRYEEV